VLAIDPDAESATVYSALGDAYPMALTAAANGNLYFVRPADGAPWQVDPAGVASRANFEWQGPTVPGLDRSTPTVSALAVRGGWLYGAYGEGMVRVRLP
jgi:hypothetical protein